eukprot:jgi/Psemu1/306813/fgenesh1_kg.283_\
MDYNDIFIPFGVDENVANITNIEWLGETEEDAINGGPRGYRVAVLIPTIDAINAQVTEEEEEDKSLLAYAMAIPILLLFVLALLATKQKKRKIITRGQLDVGQSFDDVLIGTGDPPGSFHEGMNHYTCEGVRYLSTNCAGCIETKRNDFFTANDLDTISEHSVEDDDLSTRRKKYLVMASETSLGKKHSLMDVHNCNSASCAICVYQPRDVQFFSKSEDFEGLRSGESEV